MFRRNFSHNRRRLLAFTAIAALLLTLFSATGAKPAHADCALGDIICEGQQAIQQLIDRYVGPLQLWLQFTIDKLIYQGLYQIELSVASAFWSVNKALITVGVGVGLLIGWVSANFFQPMISTGMQTFGTMTSMFFVIALFVLGLCYVLAVFIRVEVVSLRSALLWYFAALLFFQVAPGMYTSLDSFRQSLSAAFYAASMTAVQGQSPFRALTSGDTTANDPTYGMAVPCNNFPNQIQSPPGSFSGLDVALAYHKADGYDVTGSNGAPCLGNGTVQAIPRVWLKPGGYFDPTLAPELWIAPTYPDTIDTVLKTMQTAVLQGFGGIARLFNALPLIVFGIMEQLTGLCLAIAEGLAFLSFSVAVMFAFFKRTEPIAWSVLDLLISLVVQTVIIASIQALVVALYLSAAGTGSPLVTLAVSVVGLTFMGILLWSGVKAIWNAFNRLFMAFGQATGDAIVTPGAAAQTALAGAALATGVGVAGAGLLASGAASGMAGVSALENGATWAQAAGVSLGNNQQLSSAAMTLYRLPGLRGSSLGQAADQFLEGARLQSLGENLPLGNLVSPFLGARLLTDRNPDAVQEDGSQPMLTDTGRALSVFVRSPRWKRKNGADEVQDPEQVEAERREERLTGQGVRGEFTPKRPVDGEAPDGDVVGYYDRTGKAMPTGTLEALSDVLVGQDEADVKRNSELRQDLTDARDGDPQRAAQLGADQKLSGAADRLSQAASDWVASVKMNGMRADPIGERLSEGSHRRQMYEGGFTATGAGSVGAVMGDLVSLLQQQRTEAGKSAMIRGGESLSSFAVAGGMAQALNLTPVGGKPVIGQDLARYQLYAEQALRLGLDGDLTQAVATQVGERGGLQPATRDTLRSQVQATTGWSDDRVKAEIRTLENRAAMLPDEVRAVGAMPVLVQIEPMQASPAVSSAQQPVDLTPAQTERASVALNEVGQKRSILPIPRPPSMSKSSEDTDA